MSYKSALGPPLSCVPRNLHQFIFVTATLQSCSTLVSIIRRFLLPITLLRILREGLVFLPFALEILGGLHQGAITQAKLFASARARYKGLEEGKVTGQLFGRLSLTLMRANALMLSTRCQDADFPLPHIDGIE